MSLHENSYTWLVLMFSSEWAKLRYTRIYTSECHELQYESVMQLTVTGGAISAITDHRQCSGIREAGKNKCQKIQGLQSQQKSTDIYFSYFNKPIS